MDHTVKKQIIDALNGQTVLVVEPSNNYRTSIKQFLTNLKVKKLKLVSSVAEARRELLTNKVGLFIVEWGLDQTNGIQFCRSLRKEVAYKDTPFLLLSTENLKGDVVLATEASISGYLLKPFSYEDFAAQIASILLKQDKSSPLKVLLDKADALFQSGDLVQAAKGYESALLLKSNSARAFAGLARIHREKKDLTSAVAALNAAIDANPDYVEAYRILLEIQEAQGHRSGLMQTASLLHSLSPENPRYTLVLARVYLELGELEAAEKFYRKSITLSPKLAVAYKGLGNVYLAQDDYDKAMKNFKKSLDLDADDASTLNSLGMTYVRLGQFKEGVDQYMLALKLNPRDSRVLFNLGQAYEKNEALAKAKWYYSQALVHKPGFEKAMRALERLDKVAVDASLASEAKKVETPQFDDAEFDALEDEIKKAQ